MNTTEQDLKRVQDKLQQLLKQHAALKKDNLRLRSELESVKEKLAAREKNAEELKQQISVLKISSGPVNEADKKEFEKRINSYLKEIDRCIALLGE